MIEVFCIKCYDTVTQYTSLECRHDYCYNCLDPSEKQAPCVKCKVNRQRYELSLGQQVKSDCIVCGAESTKQYPFSCKHTFCKACLKGFWETQILQGNIKTLREFTCPDCKKSQPMSEERIFSLLDIGFNTNIQLDVLAVTIFGLQRIFQNLFVQNATVRFVNSVDKFMDHNEIFDQILDSDVRYCPHCDDPYMKDNHCDHVKCLSCRKEFCYFCMADYQPIQNHNASKHRVGCRNFTFMVQEIPNCGQCRNCQTPHQSLQQYVQRKGYFMRQNYLDFKSAPLYQGGQQYDDYDDDGDVDFGLFD